MRKKYFFVLLASLTFCNSTAFAKADSLTNPFFKPSTLPLEAPLFNKIKDSDYQPAFIQGMKEQLIEIQAIANNPKAPTFDNTIAALEQSGRMLERVSETFFAITQANTNDRLDAIQTEIAPKLAEHRDAIYLNPKLFARINTLYQQRDQLNLNPESLQLLQVYYKQFLHAGANLKETDQTKLRELNKKIASLETSFQQKLIAGAKASEFVINDKADLSGLNQHEIDALSKTRDHKKQYVISLQNTTQQPLLQSLDHRPIREALFNLSWNRTEKNDKNDTRQLIATLAKLRAEKAHLLNYPNYAAYMLYDQMAENPATVHQFLNQLIPPTTVRTTADAKEIQALINKTPSSSTQPFELKPWDWNYYAEQIRKIKYDLDQNQVKPYFELNQVLKNGVFYAANQLYGITFKERFDLPVYHPDVRVFDVFDQDKTQLGLIYLDYFKRDNKSGGAWMSNFVQQSKLLHNKPVVYNVTNFTKPAKGQPALLTSDDVTTMFHEFGHALQGLFSNCVYPLSCSNIARDFVELPSQFNEHWAFHPDILKNYALHYQTRQALPQTLAEKIKKAAIFNQGYSLGEILAAAELDMQWHELLASAKEQNVDAFETQALKKTHTDFPHIPPRYRSSYFLHIWANGYPAGYYAYVWTEMLDDNAYAWFTQHGGLTRENGQRFRDMILSQGHMQDYNLMFKNFYGANPTIEPLLKHRGI